MSTSSPSALSPAVRAFVWGVGAAGIVVLAHSIAALWRLEVPFEWVAFSVATFATGLLMLRVPSVDALVSISEAFAFAGVLLFGPELASVTIAVDVILLSMRRRHSVSQTVFNFGTVTLSLWLSGTLFFAVAGIPPLYRGEPLSGTLLIPLGLLAAAHFLTNSTLAAIVIGAHSRRSPFAVWRGYFVSIAPSYAAGASLALLFVVALRQLDASAIVLVVPVLLISYLTMRSSFGRLEDSKRHVEKLNGMYLSTVETLATAIDAKDEVTHGHIQRVQAAAVGLARELGITDEPTIKAIEAAALLHDTGKIAVPEHILNKPGKLTPAEFEKMKLHAPIGAEILSSIDFPYPVVPIVRHHHESWDGTGYPDGLSGTNIPIGARILSVVDCFDALTSDRPYRSRMSNQDAIRILLERRGRMYDPAIVDTFVRAHERLMPTETPLHPAARAVGGARTQGRVVAADPAATAGAVDARASEEVLGVTSLARAVAGEASVADVGALCWMMLKSMLPCAAIGLFVPDERNDTVVGRYAAGSHSGMLRNLCTPTGDGVVGWVAAHRRTAVNAEPAIDFGPRAASLDPPLRSSLAIPLVHEATLVAVLVIYASAEGAFTDDHGRLMDLLAPKLAASLAYTTRSPRQVLREGFSTEGSPRRVLHEGSSRRVLRGRF